MAENFTRRTGPPGMADESPAGRGGVDRPGRPDESGKAREAMDEARQKAASLAGEARAEGKNVLSQQKEGAAEQVGSVASALRSAADDLQQRDPRTGRFVSYAADRLENFGRQVRDKDIDSLIGDAERLGRRSPAVFFAGSVALGFLLSRFLKSSGHSKDSQRRGSASSAPRSEGSSRQSDNDWNAPADANSTAREPESTARAPMNSMPGGSPGTSATSTSATSTPALLRPGGSLADRPATAGTADTATASSAGTKPNTGGRN
jgi:hypothetical protein